MELSGSDLSEVRAHYEEMSRRVVARAIRLKAPGLVLELEGRRSGSGPNGGPRSRGF